MCQPLSNKGAFQNTFYLLSRCDSFMCSGQCNGWDVVNDFNGGKFQRSYKFSVVVER